MDRATHVAPLAAGSINYRRAAGRQSSDDQRATPKQRRTRDRATYVAPLAVGLRVGGSILPPGNSSSGIGAVQTSNGNS